MHQIINLAWKNGSVPADWRRALIIPIHKKGSRLQCRNYRGISLLSIPGKVYASILDRRVRAITEDKLLEEQGAFKRNRSCIDQMFTLRQLGEKVIEKNKKMVMVCVDLEKAYDKVNRGLLWQVIDAYGVRGRLARAVKSLYVGCEACVRVLGENSEWFKVKQGVRQGCVMSPWLFNIFIDNTIREARESFVGGVELRENTVQLLLFADDLLLVTEEEEDTQTNLRVINEVMQKWRLKINQKKTNVMAVCRGGSTVDMSVNNEPIEVVRVTKYLGAMFNEEGTCDDEIENRIGTASKAIGALRKEVLERRELSKDTKMRVFNAVIIPTLTYGCETWTLQKRHRSNIQALEMRYLRRVEGVTRADRVRNEDIRRELDQEAVLSVVDRKKKEWYKKVTEMQEDRLVKRVFLDEVPGRRPRGRPRKRWSDDL